MVGTLEKSRARKGKIRIVTWEKNEERVEEVLIGKLPTICISQASQLPVEGLVR